MERGDMFLQEAENFFDRICNEQISLKENGNITDSHD